MLTKQQLIKTLFKAYSYKSKPLNWTPPKPKQKWVPPTPKPKEEFSFFSYDIINYHDHF